MTVYLTNVSVKFSLTTEYTIYSKESHIPVRLGVPDLQRVSEDYAIIH